MPVFATDKNQASATLLPAGTYSARITKAEFAFSKAKGTPMVTLNCEIIGPDIMPVPGSTEDFIRPAGIEFTMRGLLVAGQDWGLARWNVFLLTVGLDPEIVERGDTDEYVPLLKGIAFDIYLTTKERFKEVKQPDGSYKQVLDVKGNPIPAGHEIKAELNNVKGLATFGDSEGVAIPESTDSLD